MKTRTSGFRALALLQFPPGRPLAFRSEPTRCEYRDLAGACMYLGNCQTFYCEQTSQRHLSARVPNVLSSERAANSWIHEAWAQPIRRVWSQTTPCKFLDLRSASVRTHVSTHVSVLHTSHYLKSMQTLFAVMLVSFSSRQTTAEPLAGVLRLPKSSSRRAVLLRLGHPEAIRLLVMAVHAFDFEAPIQ